MLAGWLTKTSVNVQLLADSLNLLALNMREEWLDGHFSWFKHFFFNAFNTSTPRMYSLRLSYISA